MKPGDVIRFIEYPGNDDEPFPTQSHLHGKIGILVRRTMPKWADDWGCLWAVLVEGKLHDFCYERWIEVISENR